MKKYIISYYRNNDPSNQIELEFFCNNSNDAKTIVLAISELPEINSIQLTEYNIDNSPYSNGEMYQDIDF